jgi:hypothetical protein
MEEKKLRKKLKLAFVGPADVSVKLQRKLSEKLGKLIEWHLFEPGDEPETLKYDAVILASAVAGNVKSAQFIEAIIKMLN